MKSATEVEIDGKRLKFTNLSKVFYPATGFTKADIIDYYSRISPAILPHLKNRPLTFKRYPNGVEGEFFYEKNCPVYRPKWVNTTPVWSEGRNRTIHFCMANDVPTLLWAANLAVLELHTSLSLAKNVLRPTILAFDLDPGPPANIIDCAKVALWLRDIFHQMGLQCFPKTSGSKGMQVYVPLNTAVTYDDTKTFAHAMAQMLENEHPNEITSVMKKSLRPNKVFVDWSQNDDHKTTVCVYSLRAKDRPTVSTPLTWDEVAAAHKKRKPEMLEFDYRQTLDRVQKFGDLFEPVLKLKQKMPAFSLA
jgi:bifunctional non-homologous end joining protein LigD